MSAANQPVVNITIYGDLQVAKSYYPQARQLAFQLAQAGALVGERVAPQPDGSFVRVKRIRDVYVATIYGVRPKTEPQEEVLRDTEVTLLAGLITDPKYWSYYLDGAGPTEYTATKKTYKKQAVNPKRNRYTSDLFTIQLNQSIKNALNNDGGYKGFEKYTQAGQITPSMYSGTMKTVVQLVLALGKVPVEYAFMYEKSHLIAIDPNKKHWFVEIGREGFKIAGIPVIRHLKFVEQKTLKELKELGGFPNGRVPTTMITLIEADELEPYFECTPVTGVAQGWVTNSQGTEYYNVGLYRDEVTGETWTRLFLITLDFEGLTVSASFEVVLEEKIAVPKKWWRDGSVDYSIGKQGNDFPDTPFGELTVAQQYGISGYSTEMYTDLWSENRMKWGTSGETSSWMLRLCPLMYVEHATGIEGYASYIDLPEEDLNAGETVIDAVVHVSCVNDEFHFLSYYWNLRTLRRNEIYEPVGGLFANVEGTSHSPDCFTVVTGLCGVAPTIYSNRYDTRRFRYFKWFVTDLGEGGVSKLVALGARSRNPDLSDPRDRSFWDDYYDALLEHTTPYVNPFYEEPTPDDTVHTSKTEGYNFLCHNELRIPFMSREDYALVHFESHGERGYDFTSLPHLPGNPSEKGCAVGTMLVNHTGLTPYSINQMFSRFPNPSPSLMRPNIGTDPWVMHTFQGHNAYGLPHDPPTFFEVKCLIAEDLSNIVGLRTVGPKYSEYADFPDSISEEPNELQWAGVVYRPHVLSEPEFADWRKLGAIGSDSSGVPYEAGEDTPVLETYDPLYAPEPKPDLGQRLATYRPVVHNPPTHYPKNTLDTNREAGSYGILRTYEVLIPDKSECILFMNGIEEPYSIPEFNRVNAREYLLDARSIEVAEESGERGPLVRGPQAGVSYVGERFCFFRFRNRIISFGSIPGSLELLEDDIICPVGKMENG